MVYSVGMQLRWPPSEIDCLFLDNQDFKGLEYWYDNVVKYAQDLKSSIKGKS